MFRRHASLAGAAVAAALFGLACGDDSAGPAAPPTTSSVTVAVAGPVTTAMPTTPTVHSWPEASTTGVPDGVGLQASGPLVITKRGARIEHLDVRGGIVVRADGVTIAESRVTSDGGRFAIRIEDGYSGLRLVDLEVVGTDEVCEVGVYGAGYDALRLDVSGCHDGFRVGDDTSVVDSWVHDLRATDESHNDDIQSLGGERIRIEGNRLEGRTQRGNASAAMQLDGRIDPPLRDVVIRGNLFAGGGFTLRLYNGEGGIVVDSNTFVDDSDFGPVTVNTPIDVWSANIFQDGTPVALKTE